MSLSIPTIPTVDFDAQKAARSALKLDQKEAELSLGPIYPIMLRLIGMRGSKPLEIDKPSLPIFGGSYGHVSGDHEQDINVAQALVSTDTALSRMMGNHNFASSFIDVGLSGTINSQQKNGVMPYQNLRVGSVKDMAVGPALSLPEVQDSIWVGMNVSSQQIANGMNLLCSGAVGKGGLLSAAAITAVFLEKDPDDLTRDDHTLGLTAGGQSELINRAIELNRPERFDPLDVLRCVGGVDIAAITGAMLIAGAGRVPVMIDNAISAAAALTASFLAPPIRSYLIAGQETDHPTHQVILRYLGLKPLLTANIKSGLGEGSILAVQVLKSIVSLYTSMELSINSDDLFSTDIIS